MFGITSYYTTFIIIVCVVGVFFFLWIISKIFGTGQNYKGVTEKGSILEDLKFLSSIVSGDNNNEDEDDTTSTVSSDVSSIPLLPIPPPPQKYQYDIPDIVRYFDYRLVPARYGKNGSRPEIACRLILEEIYGEDFDTYRPDFLKSPKTMRNLELDGYNRKLAIAFEYHGSQHYLYPNAFHHNEQQFIDQKSRDKYKKRKCEELGIYLIHIPYTVNKQDLAKYIWERIPEIWLQ
jgi:hypothetical protein